MQDAIELLKHYQNFRETHPASDWAAFGRWLAREHRVEVRPRAEQSQIGAIGPEALASYLLSSITAYLDTWLKLVYQDMPLASLHDFGILQAVNAMGAPTKSEIADRMVMERTTCMEALKRLVREGILADEVDPEDRRRKRVHLTEKGKALLPVVTEKMMALGRLLFHPLEAAEVRAIIPSLQKLVQFHDTLYQGQDRAEVKATYDL